MSKTYPWTIAVLVGLLLWQGYRGPQRMEQQISRLREDVRLTRLDVRESANHITTAIRERDQFPAGMSRPEATFTPDPTCLAPTARVTWSLTEPTPGTLPRLQYRRGTGEDWQEAAVTDKGDQSYVATFPLTGGPGHHWVITAVDVARPGRGPAYVYQPPEQQQARAGMPAMPVYQYRIIADMAGVRRLSGIQSLSLGRFFTVFGRVQVRVLQGGRYEIEASTSETERLTPCVAADNLTARPAADDRPLGEHPLKWDGTAWRAAWTSDTPPTRIDLHLQVGPHPKVIPIELPR